MKKIILLATIFMTSCELIIDVDVPYDDDKVVVNAIQQIDSVWTVDLSRTRYILTPPWDGYPPVDNASIVIHNPDGTTETLQGKAFGLYKGVTSPQTGSEYKVTVSTPGLEDVEATMKMPPIVKIIDVVWDSSRMNNDGPSCGNCMRANVPFTITFADPPGESNYYDVSVYIYSVHTYERPDNVVVTDTIVHFQPTYIQDPGVASEDQSEFSDRNFDGKTPTLPMIAELTNWYGEILKTEVRLTTSYEEFYKYNQTLDLQYEVMGDPFAQPVQVFSNMSNGFGIFTGTATDVKVFKP